MLARFRFVKKSQINPDEPEEISVANYYYWDVYKHRLKYPNAPALDVGSKKKPTTYIPLEAWVGFSSIVSKLSY